MIFVSISLVLHQPKNYDLYAIRFIILGNDEDFFGKVLHEVSIWPVDFANRLQVSFRPIHIPSDPSILEIYDICATERIYLPHILPEEDALVYLDTDMIFLAPPEELAKEIRNFDEDNVFGGIFMPHYNQAVANDVRFIKNRLRSKVSWRPFVQYCLENNDFPIIWLYRNNHPCYSTCLHILPQTHSYIVLLFQLPMSRTHSIMGAPLLANMTRWKQLPFDWQGLTETVILNFRERLRAGEQDAMNMIFLEVTNAFYFILHDNFLKLWLCEHLHEYSNRF